MKYFVRDGESPYCGAYTKGMEVPPSVPESVTKRWKTQGVIKDSDVIIPKKKKGVKADGGE